MLDRNTILNCLDLPKPIPVEVPEWGGTVYVKAMNAAERMKFEMLILGDKDKLMEALTVMTVCDENGKLIFQPADIDAISARNGAAISRLAQASLSLNKYTPDDVDSAEKK